ncbi:MAG TPA: hypothetical protein DDW52_28435 [Planctomycetaceae bacterium]|nr:hypothetical protein [Planctomycetaceae bacterium]
MNTKQRCTSRSARAKRSGLTLLELIIASAMIAVVMTSVSLVLRTARTSWEASDGDYSAMHHAMTVARHFVRQCREGRMVHHIGSAGESVTVQTSNGEILRWEYEASSSSVSLVYLQPTITVPLGTTIPVSAMNVVDRVPLAYQISDLSFVGYEADGVTTTSTPEDMQLLEIRLSVPTPSKSDPTTAFSSQVWIRSW